MHCLEQQIYNKVCKASLRFETRSISPRKTPKMQPLNKNINEIEL